MNKKAPSAKQHCKDMGGRLFEPESEEENGVIVSALRLYRNIPDFKTGKKVIGSVSIEFIFCFTTGCFISNGTVKKTDLSADAHVLMRKN